MILFDKKHLLQKIIDDLEKRLKLLVDSALEAKEFSTNEESKAENKYDTRGLEASYLASGQAKRAQKLQEHIYQLNKVSLRSFAENDRIGMSAIILVEANGEERYFFLLPSGGVELFDQKVKIHVITIESPIGMNLLDQTTGHDFEINGKDFEILGIQ